MQKNAYHYGRTDVLTHSSKCLPTSRYRRDMKFGTHIETENSSTEKSKKVGNSVGNGSYSRLYRYFWQILERFFQVFTFNKVQQVGYHWKGNFLKFMVLVYHFQAFSGRNGTFRALKLANYFFSQICRKMMLFDRILNFFLIVHVWTCPIFKTCQSESEGCLLTGLLGNCTVNI